MTFEQFCPECMEVTKFKVVHIDEELKVKDELITIKARYLECFECEERILDPENENENYVKAYNEYRKRKKLLLPDEIISLREQYGLSQRQLARILGWSHVTLSRYESGGIQSVSHNNELVLLHEPENMLKILKRNGENLSEKDYFNIKKRIDVLIEENKKKNFFSFLERIFVKEPSEYNGYKKVNIEKIIQVIRYFINRDPNVYKVKLLKYLWYTDFLHFKKYTMSMMGLQYNRLPMGPVPTDYEILINLILKKDEAISREYIHFGNGNPGELFLSEEDFEPKYFTQEELKTLERVFEIVSPHNSTSISEESHKEKAWIETPKNEIISYKYADELRYD